MIDILILILCIMGLMGIFGFVLIIFAVALSLFEDTEIGELFTDKITEKIKWRR